MFIITVLLCSVAEVILLEVKYQFFTGGFLQSHHLATLEQKTTFILIYSFLNIILFGVGFLIWRFFLEKFGVRKNIIAFHFMMISGIITTVSLVTQFQLHKYFADAMDFALMKNIAGGDIKNALVYVLDEAFLFIVGLLIMIALYYLIYRVVVKTLIKYEAVIICQPKKKNRFKSAGYVLSGIIIVSLAVLQINKNENVRYNLSRSNSYTVISTALNILSDIDGDGYGLFRFPQDTDILLSNIFPGALDIPLNGIDEDGFFGDFENFIPHLSLNIIQLNATEKKHIVIIIMESTRADIIGKEIDNTLVAPNITALAQTGRAINEAYSHTGYTATSIASFFSGNIGLFDQSQSLFPILKNQEYQIALFSGQDETWGGLDKKLGTREYANYFYDAQVGVEERVFPSKLPSSIKLSEKTLWQQFKKYSDDLDWNQPQFIYFNMQAAHFPYYHTQMTNKFVDTGIPRSQINSDNKDWLERTYWNSLSYADIYVGKIIAELKEKGIWENTLLIITGDHGEELFDDNHLGHGFILSDVQTKIPLIINQKDLKFKEPLGHSDMKKLILSFALNGGNSLHEQNAVKTVFQMTGSLDSPGKISLRYSGHKQIIFDLKRLEVRPLGQNQWMPYEAALKDPQLKSDLQTLILHWENLRWQNHLEKAKIQ